MILMSSEEQLKAKAIGQRLRISNQCVRAAIHAFNQEGVGSLMTKSRRPKTTDFSFNADGLERLKTLCTASPRDYDYKQSQWNRELLAAVSYRLGLTSRLVRQQTLSNALRRAGGDWGRA